MHDRVIINTNAVIPPLDRKHVVKEISKLMGLTPNYIPTANSKASIIFWTAK